MQPNKGLLKTSMSRAIAESVIVHKLIAVLSPKLKADGLYASFKQVEIPSILVLSNMELNGFGFSQEECEKQKKVLLARLEELEEKAYKEAKRQFAMTSSDEICQILYKELRLPLNGPKPSSSKEMLQKIDHPLASIILEWRKLNASVTKVVFPMSMAAERHVILQMDRIYPECQTLTATGRVSLHEPNIQMVPKDFDVIATPQLLSKAGLDQSWNKSTSLFMSEYASFVSAPDETKTLSVSLRRAFVAGSHCLILAADYAQLELRILAHLSKDERLLAILKPHQPDVFKAMAAKWKKMDLNSVTASDRAQVKQICYGILYGISAKALGEQLEVCPEEASVFISTFMDTYPGVKNFIETVIQDCKAKGFISTITGRRRYLPNITNYGNPHAQAASERQAVNSTVQGSAADLGKTFFANSM